MGMYDREPNFEDHFSEGDRFVITNMQAVGTINTQHGPAEKVLITVVTRESYGSDTNRQVTYSALGVGFANLARRAEKSDFPHVAQYVRHNLPNNKTLKTFAPVDVTPAAFVGGDDGPPLPVADPLAGVGTVNATPVDDIPF